MIGMTPDKIVKDVSMSILRRRTTGQKHIRGVLYDSQEAIDKSTVSSHRDDCHDCQQMFSFLMNS